MFTKHWFLHKNHVRPEKLLFDHLIQSWHFIDGGGEKQVLERTEKQREAEPRLGLWVEPRGFLYHISFLHLEIFDS